MEPLKSPRNMIRKSINVRSIELHKKHTSKSRGTIPLNPGMMKKGYDKKKL
jgi:hypothetical protein